MINTPAGEKLCHNEWKVRNVKVNQENNEQS